MFRLVVTATLGVGFLAGCATAVVPPISQDNPASSNARESVMPPAHPVLGEDSATQRTRQLITERAQQDTGSGAQKESMPGM
jgi:hypothetical protein